MKHSFIYIAKQSYMTIYKDLENEPERTQKFLKQTITI